jgi:hypothetical protein
MGLHHVMNYSFVEDLLTTVPAALNVLGSDIISKATKAWQLFPLHILTMADSKMRLELRDRLQIRCATSPEARYDSAQYVW